MSLYAKDEASSLRRGRIRYLPAVPGRMEFAEWVRAELLREKPDVIAVELPVTLAEAYERGVSRLPELSVIIYEDESAQSDERDDTAVYLPVEVADPFVEALRTARELGAEVVFLDPDIGSRPHVEDNYPDPFAARRVGIEKYVESYRVFPQERFGELVSHAEGLAWKLQGVNPEASVAVVV
jgi:hypothetical protein